MKQRDGGGHARHGKNESESDGTTTHDARFRSSSLKNSLEPVSGSRGVGGAHMRKLKLKKEVIQQIQVVKQNGGGGSSSAGIHQRNHLSTDFQAFKSI